MLTDISEEKLEFEFLCGDRADLIKMTEAAVNQYAEFGDDAQPTITEIRMEVDHSYRSEFHSGRFARRLRFRGFVTIEVLS